MRTDVHAWAQRPPSARDRVSPRPVAMALLALCFVLRVVGQVLVVYGGVGWLPAPEHWQSGLLPYPLLLASQVLILAALAAVLRDVWRGRGRFAAPRPRLGRVLRWAGVVYFAAMVIRYVVTMALHPEWFPFGHSIPTVFHCVLATFLVLYGGRLGGGRRWAS